MTQFGTLVPLIIFVDYIFDRPILFCLLENNLELSLNNISYIVKLYIRQTSGFQTVHYTEIYFYEIKFWFQGLGSDFEIKFFIKKINLLISRLKTATK